MKDFPSISTTNLKSSRNCVFTSSKFWMAAFALYCAGLLLDNPYNFEDSFPVLVTVASSLFDFKYAYHLCISQCNGGRWLYVRQRTIHEYLVAWLAYIHMQ